MTAFIPDSWLVCREKQREKFVYFSIPSKSAMVRTVAP